MIEKIRIQNYKSVVDLTLELGKTNVFIGENGCGKTNILEAMAMLSGAKNDRLMVQDLVNMGVRVAKPSLTKSAFLSGPKRIKKAIEFEVEMDFSSFKTSLISKKNDTIHSEWIDQKKIDFKEGFVDFFVL